MKVGEQIDGVTATAADVVSWNAGIEKDNQPENASIARVARTMEDLDNHKFEAISDRAEVFEQQNSSELMTQAASQEFINAINHEKTTEGVIKVMNEFMQFYNWHASVDEQLDAKTIHTGDFLHRLKYATTKTIGAISPLPRKMLANVSADGNDGVVFAFGGHKNSVSMYGTEVAHWDGQNIVIESVGQISLGITELQIENFRKTLLHELGHALPFVLPGNPDESHNGVMTRLSDFASRIVSHPNFTSDYATSSHDEETAETASDVLGGHVANPDNVGEFESRANKQRLFYLQQLEGAYPGITDYLIARLNPSLLHQ